MQKFNRGFTLIEILVVMFIIAISIGIIGLSVNSLQAKNDLQPFVDLLYQRLNNLEQEAILKKNTIGLNISTNKIEILDLNKTTYINNNLNKKLSWNTRRFLTAPKNVIMDLRITEKDLFITNNNPMIIFTSSNQTTPFELSIRHVADDYYYIIKSQFSGELSIEMKYKNA